MNPGLQSVLSFASICEFLKDVCELQNDRRNSRTQFQAHLDQHLRQPSYQAMSSPTSGVRWSTPFPFVKEKVNSTLAIKAQI
jgi:hypothetical protein